MIRRVPTRLRCGYEPGRTQGPRHPSARRRGATGAIARLTPELVEQIRAAKPGLLAELRERTGPTPKPSTATVVRLRLAMETEAGQRLEAILAIPRERYDGLRVLEMFHQHRMAGSTRIVRVEEVS